MNATPASRLRLLVALLLIGALAAACGGSNKVGSGLDVNKLKKNGGTRLGEVTTTLPPAPTTVPPTTRVTVAPKPTTTVPQAIALEIKIQAAAPQFNPSVGSTRSGTTIRWTNTDSQPRSVEADSGAFASGPIPPGGHFDMKAPASGTYNYHDGTRPYAVGQLQIV